MSQHPGNMPESNGDGSFHRGHRRSNAVLFGAPYTQILQTASPAFSAEHQRLLDHLREARQIPRSGLGGNARFFTNQSILQHQPQHLGYFQPIHPQESIEDSTVYGSHVPRHAEDSTTNVNYTSLGPGSPESNSGTERTSSLYFPTTGMAAPRTYRPLVCNEYLGRYRVVDDTPASIPATPLVAVTPRTFRSGPGMLGVRTNGPGPSPAALALQLQYRRGRWGYPHNLAQESSSQGRDSAGLPDPRVAIDRHDAHEVPGSWTPPEASLLGSDDPDTPASSTSSSTLVESVMDAPRDNVRASLYFGPGAILCLTSTCRCPEAPSRDPETPVWVERYGFQSVERCDCACGCDMRLMILAETLEQLEQLEYAPDLLCGWCDSHCQF